jgi:hypothetical protein
MSKTPRPKKPRKRGAPKGSQNATKHTCDTQDLSALDPRPHRTEPAHHTDLQSEIEALKEQFWYFHRQFQSTSDPKTKKSASISSIQVMDRLVEAVRCQHKAFPPEDPRLAAMRLTTDFVTKDWAWLDPYRRSPDTLLSSSAPHDPPEEHPHSQTSPGGAGPPPYGRGT